MMEVSIRNFKYLLSLIFFVLLAVFIFTMFTNKNKKTDYIIVKTQNIGSNDDTTNNEINEIKKSVVYNFHSRIFQHEFKKYSQNKEDGVIIELIHMFNLNSTPFFVEFGTNDGNECNTRYIRETLGWKGQMFDGGNNRPEINLSKETISHQTIVKLFEKYAIKDEFGILSEDTDYADYWIIEALLGKYKPKVVIHEINQQPPEKCVTVPKPDKVLFWDGSEYHGASVCAFYCLAKQLDYTMVYCESAGVNCFWVRNDLVEGYLKLKAKFVQELLTPSYLSRKPKFGYPVTNKPWTVISC